MFLNFVVILGGANNFLKTKMLAPKNYNKIQKTSVL